MQPSSFQVCLTLHWYFLVGRSLTPSSFPAPAVASAGGVNILWHTMYWCTHTHTKETAVKTTQEGGEGFLAWPFMALVSGHSADDIDDKNVNSEWHHHGFIEAHNRQRSSNQRV